LFTSCLDIINNPRNKFHFGQKICLKLTFKPVKTIFHNRPGVFRFKKKDQFLLIIFESLPPVFGYDYFRKLRIPWGRVC
jgi:hypothetical protein